MSWLEVAQIVGAILGVGGGLVAIINAIANRPKTRAEAHLSHAQAELTEADAEAKRVAVYQGLIQNLHAELGGVHSEVTALKAQQSANMKHIAELQGKDTIWQRRCDEMQAQLTSTQSQLRVLQAERQEWKNGIDALIAQLRELEIKPAWIRKDTGPLDV